MSHIPSAAMPHAKPHEAEPTITPTPAPAVKPPAMPWAALVAGGVLAIGGAVTAAYLLRGDKKRSARKGAKSADPPSKAPARRKAAARKAPAKKS